MSPHNPDPTTLAAEIYVRVVTGVIAQRSKPWALKPKEAQAIALGALEAARVFVSEALAKDGSHSP